MRKPVLISAFAFASIAASVSAQAGDRNLILASNESPAATSTATPAATSTPSAATDTAKPEATKHASKPHKSHARHTYEGDEAKARRIAAKYGVYW